MKETRSWAPDEAEMKKIIAQEIFPVVNKTCILCIMCRFLYF